MLFAEIITSRRNGSWRITLITSGIVLTAVFIVLLLNQTNRTQDPQQLVLQKHHAALRSNTSSLQTQWLKTLNPLVKNTEGGLIWNNDTQQGVMTFVNLPTIEQGEHYHVWIYDLKRSPQDPISGGAFLIPQQENNTEYHVALNPQEKVMQPYKFVVLLEPNEIPKENEEPQILLLAQP